MSEQASRIQFLVFAAFFAAALILGLIGLALPAAPQIEAGTVTVESGASTVVIGHNFGVTPNGVVFTPHYDTMVYVVSKNSTHIVAGLTTVAVAESALDYLFIIPAS
jgi:hypothetical protein